MPEEFEERTEQATPRRRQKSREKGDIPKSKDITGVVPLWIIFLYVSFGGFMFTALLIYMKTSLKRGFEVSVNELSVVEMFRTDIFQIGLIFVPLFVVMVFAIALVHFIQSGFLITSAPLSPDIKRIDPIQGIKKLFSLNTLFEAFKGIFKMIVLGFILYLVIKIELPNILLLVDMDIWSITSFSFDQMKRLFFIAVVVMTIFAVLDIVYQRWQFDRNIRMTKHELKEEYKEMEGSPIVKARIKSLQREMARKRMMQEVPKADVVITNPTHFAVALKYDSLKTGAPTIIAKGANLIAEKIKEIAKKSGVPVFEDKPLTKTLFKLDIGQEIPESLFKAVATILANVYKLKSSRAGNREQGAI